MTEKIKIDIEDTYMYAKEALVLIGYPEDLDIVTYIDDTNTPGYYILYEKETRGKKDKHLTRLSKRDFIAMMMLSMLLRGFQVEAIYIESFEKQLTCEVYIDTANYDKAPIRNRRRN